MPPMISNHALFAGLGILASLSATAAQQPPAAAPAVSRVEDGRRLYVRDGCWQCHGYAGQGGRGVPDATPVAGTRLSIQAFTRYVRQPAGAMPAYTDKVIPDADLSAVYDFIKQLPGQRPVSEIPLLKQLSEP